VSVCVVSGVCLYFVVLHCSLAFGGSFYFRIEYCNKQFKPAHLYIL
jgi:hypothetical protein